MLVLMFLADFLVKENVASLVVEDGQHFHEALMFDFVGDDKWLRFLKVVF